MMKGRKSVREMVGGGREGWGREGGLGEGGRVGGGMEGWERVGRKRVAITKNHHSK